MTPANPEHRRSRAWDLALGGLATITASLAAAALVKFADLPTRMAVVETRTNGIDTRLTSMDNKLDAILGRMGR